MTQYLEVFLEESREHIRNLNSRLLDLEKNPRDAAGLNEIFRSAHTLKGMSSTMGFDKLADLTHHMENLLADLKAGKMHANSKVIDVLFKCVDRLQILVDSIESGQLSTLENVDLIKALETIKAGHFEAVATAEQSDPFIYNVYDITILKEALSRGFNVKY